MASQSQFGQKWPKEAGMMTTYILFLCGMDVGIHFQLYFNSIENTDQEYHGFFQLVSNHCGSASVLLCSSVVRMLLILLCLGVCKKQCVPLSIQAYYAYILMTVTFLSVTITVSRLLVDSEPPQTIAYFTYLFMITTDFGFAITEYVVCRKIGIASGVTKIYEDQLNEEKKDDDRKKEITMPLFTLLKKLLLWYRPEWRLIACNSVLVTIGGLAGSVDSFLNSKLIDAINAENPKDVIPQALVMLSIGQLVDRVTEGLRRCLADVIGNRASTRTRCALYREVLNKDVGFYDETKSGKLLRKLGTIPSDMEKVWRSMDRNIRSFLYIAFHIAMMMILSWRLTMIIILGTYVMWVPNNILRHFHIRRWRKLENILSKSSSLASETVRNIRTVKSFANEAFESNRHNDKVEEYHKISQIDRLVSPALDISERVLWLIIRATVLLYGAHLITSEHLTAGQIVIFLLSMDHVWGMFGFLVDHESHQFWTALVNMETFFDYMEKDPATAPSGDLTNEDLKGTIEFSNVFFHYPTRPDTQVLKGISFTVNAGEVVGLVGASGGGKSTCIGLIQRFYDPTSGTITLDGELVRNYDNDFLHKEIGLVSQEPVLFGGTIEDNIKYGKPDATYEEIIQAAKDANCHDFITALEDGYKTDVGEAGSQMSGGQKQRIAIARALVTKPKIMLLDEATSALDAESESLVQDALQKNMKGRTVIIVAHRLSTIQYADKIVVFDKGTVIEQGSHKKLFSMNGVYSKLVRRQMRKPGPALIDNLLNETSTDEETSPRTQHRVKKVLERRRTKSISRVESLLSVSN